MRRAPRTRSATRSWAPLLLTITFVDSTPGCQSRAETSSETDGGARSDGHPRAKDAGAQGKVEGGASATAPDSGPKGVFGADGTAVVTAYGTPCAAAGAGACLGHAADLPVVCDGRSFKPAARCKAGTLCDTTPGPAAGTCRAVVADCTGKAPFDVVCLGMNRASCGPDLVTTSAVDTCAEGRETCSDGACTPCPDGKANCDSNATDCEADLQSTAACGKTCDERKVCSNAHGTASCSGGVCGTASCDPGYGDCGGTNDGCETNLRLPATCGDTCEHAVSCKWPTPACVDAACAPPPSCPVGATCGPSGDSCCGSLLVTGGSFFRSYDGTTAGHSSKADAATVSNFRLDRYEVTVGRFRLFKAAWEGGFRPFAGDGVHHHLNGGSGLADASGAAKHEKGWDTAWAKNVAPTDANLKCDPANQTWTPSVAANEDRPINCVDWYEAYAFCIWDGAFLPTEAEWNYAAAGGADQRVFPWSTPPSSQASDCTDANYVHTCATSAIGPNAVGGTTHGDGKYGQADLAGNVGEWTLDAYAPYVSPCSDCAYLAADTSIRVVRGGAFGNDNAVNIETANRYAVDLTAPRSSSIGIRCARTP